MNNSIFNISSLISKATKTFTYFNKIVPIYKEMSPIFNNARKTYNAYKSIKDTAKEAVYKEMKSLEKPVIKFQNKYFESERGKIDLDTLSFFNKKKN